MTQILVTLEDNGNPSLIQNAIAMIKGVRQVFIKKTTNIVEDQVVNQRLKAFDALSGIISISDLDMKDDRTNYILRK